MRVDLPSGGWVDLRDDLKGSDAKAARRAVTYTVDDDGKRVMNAGSDDDMRDALLARIITGWSLEEKGVLPPCKNPLAGPDHIADALSDEDYAALHQATTPLLNRMAGRPNPQGQTTPSSS